MGNATLTLVVVLLSASSARGQDLVATIRRNGLARTRIGALEPVATTGPGLATPPPSVAHVQLLGDRPGITYSIENAVDAGRHHGPRRRFTRLCTAPCELALPAGATTFLVERAGVGAQTVAPITLAVGEDMLVAHYESRGDLRAALGIAGCTLLAGGLGTFIGSLLVPNDATMSTGLIVTAIILTVLGILVASLVEVAPDDVGVEAAGSLSGERRRRVPEQLDASR